MTPALSQLVYEPFQAGEEGPTLLTLHRYREFAGAMREIGLAVNPSGRVAGLQSPKGVFLDRNIVGYTWWIGPLEQTSPVHFGDTLMELERFLWDEIDRQPGVQAKLPFLLGDEHGAAMALAVAVAVPDLLSGVIAINARFPIVPGWEPPLAPLDGLPILVIDPVGSPASASNVLSGPQLEATFRHWGGDVERWPFERKQAPADQIAGWLSRQPSRFRVND